jgi:hypothetical protein
MPSLPRNRGAEQPRRMSRPIRRELSVPGRAGRWSCWQGCGLQAGRAGCVGSDALDWSLSIVLRTYCGPSGDGALMSEWDSPTTSRPIEWTCPGPGHLPASHTTVMRPSGVLESDKRPVGPH